MERVSSMKIGILLADNRREPILEKMTVPLMPPVEIEDVARENLSRAWRDTCAPRALTSIWKWVSREPRN